MPNINTFHYPYFCHVGPLPVNGNIGILAILPAKSRRKATVERFLQTTRPFSGVAASRFDTARVCVLSADKDRCQSDKAFGGI
jgi:hypothetical protein